jgi:hypothetical protein
VSGNDLVKGLRMADPVLSADVERLAGLASARLSPAVEVPAVGVAAAEVEQ